MKNLPTFSPPLKLFPDNEVKAWERKACRQIVCSVAGFEDTLSKMAVFLASSLYDDKIVNPDVCDTNIQGVATFVCYPRTLNAIENIHEER